MYWFKKAALILVFIVSFLALLTLFLSYEKKPETITYGMSFNVLYAKELGLDWQETYDAILDDLGVRHLRLAAHWPMVEPIRGEYNFTELDYQLARAKEVGADVILAVGRRLPRWPECHVPNWAKPLDLEERNAEQLEYMRQVIERYKDDPTIKYWQVENEPFLELFAYEFCGKLDVGFLEEEIALVHELDPTRQVIVTDSGNLGMWSGAYKRGDIFGTSVYVHFWNPELGQFRTLQPAWVYRVKNNWNAMIYGEKQTFLIELSVEPWLVAPISDVPIETQFSRMDLEKFEDILKYAESTRFDKQYLWGAEWWYWLKTKKRPEMWERGQELFLKEN
ncbi:MAG: beta-galactosidase [Candidatus Nomurabacteria bacterium]|nr:MAG: beta-galactosidase [Candidatus Nomurabacteria bacterium]